MSPACFKGLVAKGALVQDDQRRWARYRLTPASYSEHMDKLKAIVAPVRSQRRLQPDVLEAIIRATFAEKLAEAQ